MKAPVRAARRNPATQSKKRTRGYSTLIYRAHKEVASPEMRSPNFLTRQLSFPKPILLRLVSSEASRLSKTNRLKVITQREIHAAAALLQQRICTRAAA